MPDPSLNPGEEGLNSQDPTLNPGEKGINFLELILLRKTQVPNLLVNPDISVQHQLSRWKIILNLFNSLWTQEYTRRRPTVTWKQQGAIPQVGDIVLSRNETSGARVQKLLKRKNGDLFGVSIPYQREAGGRTTTVDRHPNQLYPFMGVETAEPQEQI